MISLIEASPVQPATSFGGNFGSGLGPLATQSIELLRVDWFVLSMQRPPRSRFRENPAAAIFEALKNEPALLRLERINKSTIPHFDVTMNQPINQPVRNLMGPELGSPAAFFILSSKLWPISAPASWFHISAWSSHSCFLSRSSNAFWRHIEAIARQCRSLFISFIPQAQFEPKRKASFATMPITILFNGQSDQTSWIVGTADQKTGKHQFFSRTLRTAEKLSSNASADAYRSTVKKCGPFGTWQSLFNSAATPRFRHDAKSMFENIATGPAAGQRTGHDYHQKCSMKVMTAPPKAVVSLMSAKATVPPKIILNITSTNVPT